MKIGIIGGGIIGLATGKLLSEKGHKVTVFEKDRIGSHQSGNNSGVLHCGLHYKPGSLKAKLAVEGIRKMISYCEEKEIDHDVCGKVVVASNSEEVKRLEELAKRGQKNGLIGLRFLSDRELKKREPQARALKSLLVPEEGIVDYKKVLKNFSVDIENNNGKIIQGTKVEEIKKQNNDSYVVNLQNNDVEFDFIFNCAGLYTDKVYKNFTEKKPDFKIIPFRGEYLRLKPEYYQLVNHLIYPSPDPSFPFLGVHFTRMINGGREVGPNAVLALKREGYTNKDFSFSEAFESLTYPGLIKFLTRNFRFSIDEFISSLTLNGFVKKAKVLIPDIEPYMFQERTAGVRAQAMSQSGQLLMDFKIIREGNQIHVLNAPSPGATASLAIAEHIINKYTEL